jgi:hemoglobin-like flavoprotein
MEPLKAKFAAMLASAVAMLDHRAQFSSAIYDMGARHVAYGVTTAHFDPVGRALIASLEEALGPRFDADTREAWLSLFREVRAIMTDGMRSAA